MALTAGTRLGQYDILGALGAGGMGEVYRARDTTLGRDVAIKVLPELFAGDPERVGRFQREAQLLAALNHPQIAAIYGFEQSGETKFLVMELVEGESLAERIAHGDVPSGSASGQASASGRRTTARTRGLAVPEILAIGRQVGEALQAAHEKGIIHRDLKPANIMVSSDGQVKVLDFGLAKMLVEDRPESSSSAAMSPTLTLHATYAGVILGTAAYMSPEQARGKVADKRTDVWAFGCVLFEMITGTRAFDGEDATDTIAAVVRGEPNWSALPSDLPVNLRALVQGCLHKDRRQRFADISVPLFLMAAPGSIQLPLAQPSAAPKALWRRALPLAATAVVAAGLTGAAVWSLAPRPAPPIVTRFTLPIGEGQTFTNIGRQYLALSPDGTKIAYVANRRLYLRSLSDLQALPVAGSEQTPGGVTNPVFSPDSRSIAFFGSGAIKRVPVTGGAAVTICSASNPYGMSWQDDEILFAQGDSAGRSSTIQRVSANGGQPQAVLSLPPGEVAYGPRMLPGGRAMLYTVATGSGLEAWDKADIVVQELRTGARRKLLSGGTDARYVPTGHLVYAVAGVVFAVRFDLDRLQVIGGPVPIIEGVQRTTTGAGAAQFSSSDNGSVTYVAGSPTLTSAMADVALFDRQSSVQPLKLPPAPYEYPRISPDSQRLAVGTDDGKEAIIWIYDLSGASARRRLTFGGRNRVPIWTHDSQRVVFQSDRDGDPAIFWQPADGNGAAERLTTPDKGTAHVPQSWAPDGKRFLFTAQKAASSVSLWAFSMADRQAAPYGGVEATAVTAAFSPDGRWVAYQEAVATFVQPFPATGAKYQIGNGIHPFWSPDGKELINQPRGGLQAVTVTTTPSFSSTAPVEIRRTIFQERGPSFERSIDIHPDGKRFVGVFGGLEDSAGTVPQIQVVEHWFEELKARAPVK